MKVAAATGAVATLYAAPRFNSFGPKPAYASITGVIPCLSFIDFDTIGGLGAGDKIGTNNSGLQPWSGFGVTVESLLRDQSAFHPFGGMIFNSAIPTGSDADLRTPSITGGIDNTVARFNVLIISEDGVSSPITGPTGGPDDDAAGGVIVFQFNTPRKLTSIGLLDIDLNEGGNSGIQTRISAYDTAPDLTVSTADHVDDLISSAFDVTGLGNNSWQTVPFVRAGVRELRIRFRNSGAIGRIDFDCP
ncbi:MAG: hypothetical protein IH960_07195 [Chloroflexi bacterium]|nr:hypothetical protein [Chloroflexota bacterium]